MCIITETIAKNYPNLQKYHPKCTLAESHQKELHTYSTNLCQTTDEWKIKSVTYVQLSIL